MRDVELSGALREPSLKRDGKVLIRGLGVGFKLRSVRAVVEYLAEDLVRGPAGRLGAGSNCDDYGDLGRACQGVLCNVVSPSS